jgi:hypothetical protein
MNLMANDMLRHPRELGHFLDGVTGFMKLDSHMELYMTILQ